MEVVVLAMMVKIGMVLVMVMAFSKLFSTTHLHLVL